LAAKICQELPIRLESNSQVRRKLPKTFDDVVLSHPESDGISRALGIAWRTHGTEEDGQGADSRRAGPGMKVTCAWCQREGQPASLGERAPLDDPAETHGICRRHTLELLGRIPSRSFPGVRLLLVVSPRASALFEHLQRELAGVRGVKVILDRRRSERRQHGKHGVPEQRRIDRRLRQGEVSALGYTVIRFGRA
jgi:hypothetical protein